MYFVFHCRFCFIDRDIASFSKSFHYDVIVSTPPEFSRFWIIGYLIVNRWVYWF